MTVYVIEILVKVRENSKARVQICAAPNQRGWNAGNVVRAGFRG